MLDPFCGCGTTIAACQRLDRHWIGIDITHLATNLIKHRLSNAYGESVEGTYEVTGEPVSLAGARELASTDAYQFQYWALSLVRARPAEMKKGADRGIDGRRFFHEAEGGETSEIIFSVKAGHTGPDHMRDLRGVIEREDAATGALICMQEPTKSMRSEAASAGFYSSPWGRHPKVQILTIEELLNGKQLDAPPTRQVDRTFKKAPRVAAAAAKQPSLYDVQPAPIKAKLAKAKTQKPRKRKRG